MRHFLCIFAATFVSVSSAIAQDTGLEPQAGNPANGQVIAVTWCSACHLVGADEARTVLADVPTFTAVAERLPTDADILAAFIANPHPPMPDLNLTRQQIRDILAYIATLK